MTLSSRPPTRPTTASGRVDQPIDDRFEQRLLRAEVVVEGALRRADVGEQVLDAELLVAAASGSDAGRRR